MAGFSIIIPMTKTPYTLKHFLYSILNLHLMRPSQRVEFGDINEFAHRAVGLGTIKFYCALEAHSLYFIKELT